MCDVDGRPIDDRRVEELANGVNISLRTGCFCNPGAGEIAHGLTADHMRRYFGRPGAVSFVDLRDDMLASHELLVSAIRVSVGIATNFTDVYRLMCFLQGFLDQTVADMNGILSQVPEWGTGRRAKLDGIKTAGKTGTTSAFRDGWFVGYTGNFTAAVWMGNDDYRSTRRLISFAMPGRITLPNSRTSASTCKCGTSPSGTAALSVRWMQKSTQLSSRRLYAGENGAGTRTRGIT